MSDSGEPRAERPRFPFVAATFCAACASSAVWLFFAYSYAWEVSPKDVVEGRLRRVFGGSPWKVYVRLRGETVKARKSFRGKSAVAVPVQDAADPDVWMIARVTVGRAPSLEPGGEVVLTGRLALRSARLGKRVFEMDTAAGRWTGESVAGLAAGAMGLFVFGTAFGHWRKGRRASRRGASEAAA